MAEKILFYLKPEYLLPIVFYIFIAAAGIQLFYYLFIISRLAFFNKSTASIGVPAVTVLISARNELKNLKTFLASVLEQSYADFQVIVVNDCSWDESSKYLEEMTEKYSHLKIVEIKEQEKYQHGKKFALSLGIKAAKNEILVFTDADCRPAGPNWISELVKHYQPGTEIIIGYGAYIKEKGLLNRWIRFDTVFNAIQYLSYAIGKNPYMGVGRNLSYSKSLFFKNKGFASHYHILSGDDDLFINETATANNTAICISPESFTYSKAKTNWIDWFRQKRRHMSAGRLYKFKHKFLLGSYFLSHLMFYAGLVVLLPFQFNWEIIVGVYVLRLIVQLIIFGRSMKKLREMDLIWFLPFFDFMVFVFYPVLGVVNLFFKNKTWK